MLAWSFADLAGCHIVEATKIARLRQPLNAFRVSYAHPYLLFPSDSR
jgi:hypothetical protein